MRPLAALLACLPLSLAAQTLWPVSVGGSTIGSTLPYYSPQNLTISVGDQVRWSNVSGTHNVNGTLALFPGNPEGFTSGDPASGSWDFTKTFTIPGVYNYHCTNDGHAATQFGSITVADPNTGLADWNAASDEVSIRPLPALDQLTIDLGSLAAHQVDIIDLNGEVVRSAPGIQARIITMDVSALSPASYFVLIRERDGRVTAKPFMKL